MWGWWQDCTIWQFNYQFVENPKKTHTINGTLVGWRGISGSW
jgi:hypothetical protein